MAGSGAVTGLLAKSLQAGVGIYGERRCCTSILLVYREQQCWVCRVVDEERGAVGFCGNRRLAEFTGVRVERAVVDAFGNYCFPWCTCRCKKNVIWAKLTLEDRKSKRSVVVLQFIRRVLLVFTKE